METDDNSSGALGAGEHGGGSHQLQSPGSNPLGVGQGGNAAEGYVAKYAAKEDTTVRREWDGFRKGVDLAEKKDFLHYKTRKKTREVTSPGPWPLISSL